MHQPPYILKIGRSPENEIQISGNSVSRKHAEIFVDPSFNVFLSDLNSTNGTFVNGVKLLNPIILKRGDKIVVGNNHFVEWEKLIFGQNLSNDDELSTSSAKFEVVQIKELIVIYSIVFLLAILLISIT